MKLHNQAFFTGMAARIVTALTILAAIPYELGDAAQYLPPDIKATIVKYGVFAAIALQFWQGMTERLQGKKDAAGIAAGAAAAKGIPPIVPTSGSNPAGKLLPLLLVLLCLSGCAPLRDFARNTDINGACFNRP